MIVSVTAVLLPMASVATTLTVSELTPGPPLVLLYVIDSSTCW